MFVNVHRTEGMSDNSNVCFFFQYKYAKKLKGMSDDSNVFFLQNKFAKKWMEISTVRMQKNYTDFGITIKTVSRFQFLCHFEVAQT